LRNHLATFEVDWEHGTQDFDEQIHRSLGFERLELIPVARSTMWFHATRAVPNEHFSNGLLPTMPALEKLSPLLRSLALRWISPKQWDEYRRSWDSSDRPFAQQFNRKQLLDTWQGPFAFLVRACAVGGRSVG